MKAYILSTFLWSGPGGRISSVLVIKKAWGQVFHHHFTKCVSFMRTIIRTTGQPSFICSNTPSTYTSATSCKYIQIPLEVRHDGSTHNNTYNGDNTDVNTENCSNCNLGHRFSVTVKLPFWSRKCCPLLSLSNCVPSWDAPECQCRRFLFYHAGVDGGGDIICHFL